MKRKYYEAYDERYRQVHSENLQWFYDDPTPIVEETILKYGINGNSRLLELGCGEGRDAFPLLAKGYRLLATDISLEAIDFAKNKRPEMSKHFSVLDCIGGQLQEKFDFIYAVAVLHMLVEDTDRDAFFSFIRKHLNPKGIALICTMGDGNMERQTDINTAFDLQKRTHEQTGKEIEIASTSCRVVSFETLRKELNRNQLSLIQDGLASAPPDFPVLMYAIVKGQDKKISK